MILVKQGYSLRCKGHIIGLGNKRALHFFIVVFDLPQPIGICYLSKTLLPYLFGRFVPL